LCNHAAVPKDVDAFFRALEGELPPVIAMGGEERVHQDDALATISERALAGAMKDFNWDRTSGRERRAAEIVSMCNALPVMATRRLVEVRDAEGLASEVEVIERYLENPSKETVLVLMLASVDMRDKLTKLLDKQALLCKFEHPKDRDMPRHIERRAKKHKLKLGHEAVEALAATVGADLTLLERALEKLALACEGEVSIEDIENNVADTRLADAFEWVRAVAMGNRAGALTGLKKLEADREEPIRLMGLLAWQLRQLTRARALMDDGKQGQVGSELNLFGDRLNTALSAARRLSLPEHSARLTRLAGVDRLLKGSRQPPWLVMTRLTEELCRPPRSPRPASAASARSPRR
jgi:DNA polymerase III subunit delta